MDSGDSEFEAEKANLRAGILSEIVEDGQTYHLKSVSEKSWSSGNEKHCEITAVYEKDDKKEKDEDLDKFKEFGTISGPQPYDEIWDNDRKSHIERLSDDLKRYDYAPKSWREDFDRERDIRFKGVSPDSWERNEDHIGPKDVTSAESAFEKGYVPEQNHFGIEIEIDANDAYDAEKKAKEILEDKWGFEKKDNSGFAWGSEQYRRTDDLNQNQEHLRYYGVQKVDDGLYHAILIGERE